MNGSGGWRKSSYSGVNGCVEVWVKSSWSTTNGCVEVVTNGEGIVQVRDSERPDDIVWFSPESWRAFILGVKDGEFDLV